MTTGRSTTSRAVVIATKDRGASVVAALESVLIADLPELEVVVVDQSDDDCTEHAVRPLLTDARLRYVHSSRRGLSRGRNDAVGMCSADLIMITDDDCVVPTNWVEEMARPFEADGTVGVVFCSVAPAPVDQVGLTPHVLFDGTRTLTDFGAAWRAGRHGLALGAGMAVRRTAFEDVDGFDELLGPGARFGAVEDNDLSWRALLRGWATVHCADVVVVHHGFRPLSEIRALVTRDFYGVGGAIAKYLRRRDTRSGAARFALAWLVHFGVRLPFVELCRGRRPSGLRRPMMLVKGIVDGLRTRVDRRQLVYLARSGERR